MFGITGLEVLIFLAILGGIVWALWYVFNRTTTGQLSEEEQYIQRLNAQWALQREQQRLEAEAVRRRTEERIPSSGSTPTAPVVDPTARAGNGSTLHASPSGPNPSQADYAEVVRLVQQGKLVEAVKKVRQDTGAGLVEAKQLVDHISRG